MPERNQVQYDLLGLQYLDALEAEDWDTIGELWKEAETDPELESLLLELGEGLLEESGWEDPFASDADKVRDLLNANFSQRPEPAGPAPLTAADVAARLLAEQRQGQISLSPQELQTIELLKSVSATLPAKLGQGQFEIWVKGLGISGGDHFWREFRRVATLLSLSQSQRDVRLAARQETPSPRKADDAS